MVQLIIHVRIIVLDPARHRQAPRGPEDLRHSGLKPGVSLLESPHTFNENQPWQSAGVMPCPSAWQKTDLCATARRGLSTAR